MDLSADSATTAVARVSVPEGPATWEYFNKWDSYEIFN